MESCQYIRHLSCRSIATRHFPPCQTIRHPSKNRHIPPSRYTRRSSTTSSPPPRQNPSPPSSQETREQRVFPSLPPPPREGTTTTHRSSTARKPSPWSPHLYLQRQHGTTPTPSPPVNNNATTLQRTLDSKLDLLSLVSNPRHPPSSSSTTSPTPTTSDLMSSVSHKISDIEAQNFKASMDAVHLRLGPMLGRTVAVQQGTGFDLQSALRVLEIRCAHNKVKHDNHAQRTHVRKGQVRKDMKSKRWRALFKVGFLAEVGRVRRMKAQGW